MAAQLDLVLAPREVASIVDSDADCDLQLPPITKAEPRREVVVPAEDTQAGMLLRAFQRGEALTVAEALTRYGVYALSQRCGQLRSWGWPIQSKTVEIKPGTRVSQYWMGSNGED